jgi:hypothetical protein
LNLVDRSILRLERAEQTPAGIEGFVSATATREHEAGAGAAVID